MKNKITIKSIFDDVLFEHEAENNTIGLTVEFAVKNKISLLSANLPDADLLRIKLLDADLRDANLSYAYLQYTDLSFANLSGATLSGADLSHANLQYSKLSGANLLGADLYYANLSCTDLSSANLSDIILLNANLSGVNLKNFNLLGINFNGVKRTNTSEIKPCKWSIIIKDDNSISIGCKDKSIEEWDKWFDSSEEYETSRNTQAFKLIYENYLNVKNILNQIKNYE